MVLSRFAVFAFIVLAANFGGRCGGQDLVWPIMPDDFPLPPEIEARPDGVIDIQLNVGDHGKNTIRWAHPNPAINMRIQIDWYDYSDVDTHMEDVQEISSVEFIRERLRTDLKADPLGLIFGHPQEFKGMRFRHTSETRRDSCPRIVSAKLGVAVFRYFTSELIETPEGARFTRETRTSKDSSEIEYGPEDKLTVESTYACTVQDSNNFNLKYVFVSNNEQWTAKYDYTKTFTGVTTTPYVRSESVTASWPTSGSSGGSDFIFFTDTPVTTPANSETPNVAYHICLFTSAAELWMDEIGSWIGFTWGLPHWDPGGFSS